MLGIRMDRRLFAISPNFHTYFRVIIGLHNLEVVFEGLPNIRNISEVRSEEGNLLGGRIEVSKARGRGAEEGRRDRVEVLLCAFKIYVQPARIDSAVFEVGFFNRSFFDRSKKILNSFFGHRMAIRLVLRIVSGDNGRTVRLPKSPPGGPDLDSHSVGTEGR